MPHEQDETLVSLTPTMVHGHQRRVSVASTSATSTGQDESRASTESKRVLSEDSDRERDSPSPIETPRPVPTREQTVDPRWLPTIIPPDHQRRTLVVCLDGTGDQFDADNSNIVKFFSMLMKDDKEKQMVYYQSGIGTYTSPQIMTPLSAKVMQALDAAIAWNLDTHVMNAYEFLMQNYTVGDAICLFGFSRGAYTARSLAGMLHKVGLLPADNWQQVPFAYKMYTRTDEIGWKQSNAFKKAFSRDVSIEFVGVWDTVDSVGLVPKRLPLTTSNTIVRTFRHALALDERRAKFLPNVWNQPSKRESHFAAASVENKSKSLGDLRTDYFKVGKRSGEAKDPNRFRTTRSMPVGDLTIWEEEVKGTPREALGIGRGGIRLSKRRRNSQSHTTTRKKTSEDSSAALSALERLYSERATQPTDVQEVWFAGCHCDVGGGSVKNDVPHSLARISLRWMIRECFKAESGIMFDGARLREIGLDPSDLFPIVTPRAPPLHVGERRIESLPKSPSTFSKLAKWGKRALRAVRGAPPAPDFVHAEKRPIVQEGLHDFHGPDGELLYGNEEEEELRDALSPKYDQLRLMPLWYLLELWPIKVRRQNARAEWEHKYSCNLAEGRTIPMQRAHGVKVHRSVRMRQQAGKDNGKAYVPKARFFVEPTWVD